jgi:hypothetical protein
VADAARPDEDASVVQTNARKEVIAMNGEKAMICGLLMIDVTMVMNLFVQFARWF